MYTGAGRRDCRIKRGPDIRALLNGTYYFGHRNTRIFAADHLVHGKNAVSPVRETGRKRRKKKRITGCFDNHQFLGVIR